MGNPQVLATRARSESPNSMADDWQCLLCRAWYHTVNRFGFGKEVAVPDG